MILVSSVKERIIGAVSIMNDKDAEKVWQLILATFSLAGAEEEEALPDEIAAIKAYQSGDPEYQPAYLHEDVIKKLDLS